MRCLSIVIPSYNEAESLNELFLRIDSNDSLINSYISTTKENAIAQAEKEVGVMNAMALQ